LAKNFFGGEGFPNLRLKPFGEKEDFSVSQICLKKTCANAQAKQNTKEGFVFIGGPFWAEVPKNIFRAGWGNKNGGVGRECSDFFENTQLFRSFPFFHKLGPFFYNIGS